MQCDTHMEARDVVRLLTASHVIGHEVHPRREHLDSKLQLLLVHAVSLCALLSLSTFVAVSLCALLSLSTFVDLSTTSGSATLAVRGRLLTA